ncbi:protein FAR1-RELATED SEQUENCE 5 isoform X1 [Elaeis guineensis]|uniref:Protein FAR1-RELATED SEQUENCE n=1 Tax=Elaeis guineensis var. tenera TaxID=51953 RepID=A0A6I9RQF4_ELAGV|nr:protein FAR1-RELATED SEQUENCE 5 [Elaeis guineensis]
MAELAEPDPLSGDADDTSWVPRVDMEFKSDEEAYQFYNHYSKVVGFSVRKAWINRRASGVIISRTYVCYKEGYQGNRKDESEVKKPRQNERTGCLAHLTIKITANGTYRVSEFHPMHNHELVAPAKAHTLKSHRVAKKARAVIANAASQKAMMECLVRQAGGYRQVTFFSVEDAADKSWAPKVDMEFENDEKAYQFYNDYAKRIGFDVRKAWVNRRSSGVIISRTYVCYKEGYYGNKKDETQVEKHRIRPNERTGCLARMVIKLAKNGRYRVTEFQPMHNHEFVTARTAHTLKSHRAANKIRNVEVNSVDDSSVAAKAIHDHASGQDASSQHLTFLSMEYKNYLPVKRKDAIKPGDVGAMLEYMQERQVNDPSFYYAIQLDEEDRVTNVFWTDGKSMADYYYFGDAVCFDTTYKTNSCSRPFSPFYGVNHHKQIVIFGAALIYDETKESFRWLFETFKTAMYGKQPRVILTDQNPLIRNAINLVWPCTTHRVCVWHMYQNASKYLGQVFQGSRTFAYDFSRCLFDYEEEEEFVSAWENMLEKYDLKGNEWLKMLFEDREKWAVAYGRETFCADMKSTQRLDSISGMLKEYLSPERDLLQFLKHFERMLDEQRNAELQADFHATPSISIIAPSRMLRQAASEYTPAVFEMFQREFEMSMDCMVHNSGAVETIYEYKVISEENPKVHLVRFDSLNGTLVCSCKKFEFVGIQCRHVLKALDIINIKELPPQYYLKRWKKDAKVGSLRDNLGLATDIDPSSSKAMRLSSLCRIISIVAARAAETVEGYTFVQNQSDQLFDHVCEILQARPPEELQIS